MAAFKPVVTPSTSLMPATELDQSWPVHKPSLLIARVAVASIDATKLVITFIYLKNYFKYIFTIY